MPAPLEGFLVLDWTIWQQGPVCSAMLGDMGADVIKIEQRGTGDPGRWLLAAAGQEIGDRPNWYFEANNRNKKSITLDLKKPEGIEIVHELAKKADVFVQNFRKDVAARNEIGYEHLREINPRIIYASATGYGPKGPDSAEPSFDHLGLARSGIMNAAGEPGMPPLGISGGIADQMGAIMMAYGIMTAVVARERHGMGQEVNASHLGSMSFLQGLSLSMKLMAGVAMPRSFRARAFNPLWNHYECGDGQWIALAMLQSDRYWPDVARLIERPELATDERYATAAARAGR
jgi:CoA:oxalate CoA-transferase